MLKNILLIDDSKLMRERIKMLLNDFQSRCNILEAADTFEGERMINQIHPDILILDVSMPDRNGIDFLQTLQEYPYDMVIIVLTNFSSELYKQKVEELGASYFLSKHEDFEKLYITVRKILNSGNSYKVSGF